MITHNDFKKIEIRVGEILSAERFEGSGKLLKLSVDLGEEEQPRQVIAGIAGFFPDLSILIGKRCAFVTNLEPRTLMGEISEGMILAAGDNGFLSLLEVEKSISVGTLVR